MKASKKEQKSSDKKHETIPKHEHDELKDMLQRIHAEFQNYRARTEQEKSQFIKLSNESLIKNLIPIVDNFELALSHVKDDSEFVQGMKLIYTQLLETLEQEGLAPISANGKFDPKLHEAVMIEETNKEPGVILQELQRGYTLNNKVIRSSKVKISKKKQEVDKNE